jgi:hypothetical protein
MHLEPRSPGLLAANHLNGLKLSTVIKYRLR